MLNNLIATAKNVKKEVRETHLIELTACIREDIQTSLLIPFFRGHNLSYTAFKKIWFECNFSLIHHCCPFKSDKVSYLQILFKVIVEMLWNINTNGIEEIAISVLNEEFSICNSTDHAVTHSRHIVWVISIIYTLYSMHQTQLLGHHNTTRGLHHSLYPIRISIELYAEFIIFIERLSYLGYIGHDAMVCFSSLHESKSFVHTLYTGPHGLEWEALYQCQRIAILVPTSSSYSSSFSSSSTPAAPPAAVSTSRLGKLSSEKLNYSDLIECISSIFSCDHVVVVEGCTDTNVAETIDVDDELGRFEGDEGYEDDETSLLSIHRRQEDYKNKRAAILAATKANQKFKEDGRVARMKLKGRRKGGKKSNNKNIKATNQSVRFDDDDDDDESIDDNAEDNTTIEQNDEMNAGDTNVITSTATDQKIVAKRKNRTKIVRSGRSNLDIDISDSLNVNNEETVVEPVVIGAGKEDKQREARKRGDDINYSVENNYFIGGSVYAIASSNIGDDFDDFLNGFSNNTNTASSAAAPVDLKVNSNNSNSSGNSNSNSNISVNNEHEAAAPMSDDSSDSEDLDKQQNMKIDLSIAKRNEAMEKVRKNRERERELERARLGKPIGKLKGRKKQQLPPPTAGEILGDALAQTINPKQNKSSSSVVNKNKMKNSNTSSALDIQTFSSYTNANIINNANVNVNVNANAIANSDAYMNAYSDIIPMRLPSSLTSASSSLITDDTSIKLKVDAAPVGLDVKLDDLLELEKLPTSREKEKEKEKGKRKSNANNLPKGKKMKKTVSKGNYRKDSDDENEGEGEGEGEMKRRKEVHVTSENEDLSILEEYEQLPNM